MQEEDKDTKNVEKRSKGNYAAKNKVVDEDDNSKNQDTLEKNDNPKKKTTQQRMNRQMKIKRWVKDKMMIQRRTIKRTRR